jgi:hypothetical protein
MSNFSAISWQEQVTFDEMMISALYSTQFFFFIANYLGSWKCIAVLKGDGSQSKQMDINQSTMPSSGPSQVNSSVRYFQVTPVAKATQVVWH